MRGFIFDVWPNGEAGSPRTIEALDERAAALEIEAPPPGYTVLAWVRLHGVADPDLIELITDIDGRRRAQHSPLYRRTVH